MRWWWSRPSPTASTWCPRQSACQQQTDKKDQMINFPYRFLVQFSLLRTGLYIIFLLKVLLLCSNCSYFMFQIFICRYCKISSVGLYSRDLGRKLESETNVTSKSNKTFNIGVKAKAGWVDQNFSVSWDYIQSVFFVTTILTTIG